ncbi:hydrogenase formation protein HypD [Butyrivibrio sp. DSM 10294]|uniref:hydrogenase formation protein HypD n=1 Tax=Butyrivibrio sp. DSM 10294 TaxID=2972457 RepID=UPI00234F46E2|nr:hydrogenase formation protein HypD [Butyrivibrio sp. DSM 10294]MDC7295277.1 hydrogenase formation protein HypD [Butyrivibrio sp. DSM 10294]
MRNLEEIITALKEYDGEEVRIMEVCGTHTAAISENGIPDMLSPKIKLISGPGCPVCVTVTAVIDKLVELAMREDTCVLTFGDLIRVKGTSKSLADAKADGAHVRMVYSPMESIKLAEEDPAHTYVFAAIGFETTTPVYAMLLEEAVKKDLKNLKLLTSLKTMPEVIRWVVTNGGGIDGFIAPGHVAAVTGSGIFEELSKELGIPFVVSGFEGAQLLMTIYALISMKGKTGMKNLYKDVVSYEGNIKAQEVVNKYFEPSDSSWRGMGKIPGSGMTLRKEFSPFDAGSIGLDEDHMPPGCQCANVLVGKLRPYECPLFGKACTPDNAHGACMVSTEGSCYNYFVSGRK